MSKQRSFEIDRRGFLYGAGSTILGLNPPVGHAWSAIQAGETSSQAAAGDNCLYASNGGSDDNPGTELRPLQSFHAAQRAVAKLNKSVRGSISVFFRAGTYYLPEPVVFSAEDSGQPGAPIVYSAYPGESVILSGGNRIAPVWTSYRDGIMQTPVPPETDTDQLFVNGQRQILARYPNYDPNAKYLNGWSEDAISPERVSRWSDPVGGYIHALHKYLWGSLHYQITGKDAGGNLTYDGGWQSNRPAPMHKQYLYVENIFEELDSPGEWFLDRKKHILYFYPPPGLDLKNAVVEVARSKHVVEARGTAESPVRWIELRNFTFRHTLRTFMETKEPLLRSDWRIYRGGALYLAGTEDFHAVNCTFDQLGGNCIFVSNYNRRFRASQCHMADAGASGIAFVGDPAAVRSPLFNYDERHTVDQLDRTAGPLTNNYPENCTVEDCLIYRTGRVEKQTAPVEIDMSKSITVRHVSAYEVPRAGINIGDGCWGGHHIDYCDIFDTVKETGDHGSFNSWGRDRWWGVKGIDFDSVLSGELASLPVLDAVEPNILSNSRWRCDHGWDIDLDDGSSNFHIYNNLCLKGGLKLREGFYRICENNVLVSNSLHAHVWFNDSHDVFRNNILFTPYRPIQMRKWTQEIDFNLLQDPDSKSAIPAKALQALSAEDTHSLDANARFINAPGGDYRVKPDSPAISLGFVNFDMRDFGVQAPELRAIARTPELPSAEGAKPVTLDTTRSREVMTWEGAKVRNIVGLDEVSAAGTPGETGVTVLDVPPSSDANKAGITAGDVILAFNNKPVKDTQDLIRYTQEAVKGSSASITILRYQQESTVKLSIK
jgi:hypothetical protein